jgi:hypothetical protein
MLGHTIQYDVNHIAVTEIDMPNTASFLYFRHLDEDIITVGLFVGLVSWNPKIFIQTCVFLLNPLQKGS